MNKKTLFTIALLTFLSAVTARAGILDFITNLFSPQQRLGATVSQSIQGGTGTSTPPTDNSILLGHASDKTYNVKTLTAGSNITFTETGNALTIASTGGGGSFPFDPIYNGAINSTSTILGFLGGFVSSGASSTISDELFLKGAVNATSTVHIQGAATLAGGLTLTCTGCITDLNAADIALGGGTSGNYVRTIADSGNSTVTVVGSGAEDADVTLNVIDVNCTDCLGVTEIADSYVLNTTDTMTGSLTVGVSLNATSTIHADSNIISGGLLTVSGAGTSTFTGGSTFAGLTSSNGIFLSSGVIRSDDTGSSTFLGGATFARGIGVGLTNCNTLDTDASGYVICGTDETGGSAGVPNLIYRSLSGTKYYTASTSATDNLAWHFANGFVSSASSSIAGDLRIGTGILGVGTTTASVGTLSVQSSGTTTLYYESSSATQGTCLIMRDMGGAGVTYITSKKGVLYTSTSTSCK